MPRSRPTEIEFVDVDDARLLAAAAALTDRGEGWINLEPIVDEEHQPMQAGPFAFLAGPSHDIPTVTWMPGRHQPGGETKPTTVGLQHAAGPRVARTLAASGLPLPEQWRVTQDHPRRGLVASVPAAVADPRSVLEWLLRAAASVCTVTTTGRWRAAVHDGRTG
ncbi:MAG: hypothetical protein JO368_11625 [Acidimicrobiales bacterium]|nr:hypothetical protein [Acidimicrobiales bacterium]